MAFVRKKKIRRKYERYGSNKDSSYRRYRARQSGSKENATIEYEYYYLVESYRDQDGNIKQRTLASLGQYPTLQEAIDGYTERAESFRKYAENFKRKAKVNPHATRGKYANWRKAGKEYALMAEKSEQRAERLKQFLDVE